MLFTLLKACGCCRRQDAHVHELTWWYYCVSRGIKQDTLIAKSCKFTLDPSKTERWHFVKSDSKYSRVEMCRVSWSTVHWDEPLMVPTAERLFTCLYFISRAKVCVSLMTSIGNKLQGGESKIFGHIFWKMCWCSGNTIVQIDLFWPSSWHVNCHFYLLGVSVNHIFFPTPDCVLARTSSNILMPKNLLLWCGQQTGPKLNLLVLLVLAAACKSALLPQLECQFVSLITAKPRSHLPSCLPA